MYSRKGEITVRKGVKRLALFAGGLLTSVSPDGLDGFFVLRQYRIVLFVFLTNRILLGRRWRSCCPSDIGKPLSRPAPE